MLKLQNNPTPPPVTQYSLCVISASLEYKYTVVTFGYFFSQMITDITRLDGEPKNKLVTPPRMHREQNTLHKMCAMRDQLEVEGKHALLYYNKLQYSKQGRLISAVNKSESVFKIYMQSYQCKIKIICCNFLKKWEQRSLQWCYYD